MKAYCPGTWRVIVQTPSVQQRVGVDMCHSVDLPCPGLADCGKKSRCVQRYNHQVGTWHVYSEARRGFVIIIYPIHITKPLQVPSQYRNGNPYKLS